MDSTQLSTEVLSRDEYRQYLREVCHYEKNLLMINLSIDRLKEQMSGLGVSNHIRKPVKGMQDTRSKAPLALRTSVIMGFIPIVIISFALMVLTQIIAVGVAAFFVLHVIWYLITFKILDSERKTKNKEIQKRDDKEQADYEEALQGEKRRLEIENLQRQSLACDISNFEIDRGICSRTLSDLYACNILHPKYRNFAAAASFYDYIDTGRCSSLEGPNGAYATYEMESRMDKIISKLDQVLDKLEQIRQNQEMLYSEIRDAYYQSNLLASETLDGINRIAQRTDEQLYQLAENQRLIEYNTRISAESAETMKHVMLYKERVGGPLPVSYPNFDR
ncbi:MAG: hypothetical protein NC121_04835 [Blautia sp.]|nr:hypothetical protein [Blautia sp.]